MMTDENVRKAMAAMESQRSQMPVADVITAHLHGVASQLPEGKLPNGLAVEDGVSVILDTAREYVATRDQQISSGTTLTHQEIRQKIGGNLFKVTREQAVDYLASLHLVYKYMAPGAAAAVTAEDLEAEYNQLKMSVAFYPLDEQVEMLVDTLDVAQADRFLDMADVVQEGICNGEDITATIQAIKVKDLDVETAAIAGAALYGEAVLGRIPDLAPEVNPGIVTAKAAAAVDAMTTAIQVEQGKLTEEQAVKKLDWILKALAVALALAVIALLIVAVIQSMPAVISVIFGKITCSKLVIFFAQVLAIGEVITASPSIYQFVARRLDLLTKLYHTVPDNLRRIAAKQFRKA